MGSHRGFGFGPQTLRLGAAALVLASLQAYATTYNFTSIADSATGPFTNFGYGPAINDGGQVAFTATGASFSDQGIYVGSGGALTTIADTSANFFSFSFDPVINNAGTVAFAATAAGPGPTEIHIGNGGATTRIAVGDGSTVTDGRIFGNLFSPSINNNGTVAFAGNLVSGGSGGAVFTYDGGPLVQRWSGGTSTFLDVNDSGQLSFGAVLTNPNPPPAYGLVVDNNGPFSIIALQSPDGPYDILDPRIAINKNGTVAFQAFQNVGGGTIYTYNGSTLVPIAQSTTSPTPTTFSSVGSGPAISDNGLVVFQGAIFGSPGIFTGPDTVADKVIKVGDTLFGMFVTDVSFLSGVNAHGQIAFKYTAFDFGTNTTVNGIAVATPGTSDDITTTGSASTSVGGGLFTLGGLTAAFDNVTDPGRFSADFFRPTGADMLAVRIGQQATGLVDFGLASPEFQVWTLDFSGEFTGDVQLVFHYDDTALDVPESSLVIRHFTGGQWVTPAGQVLDTLNNTITLAANSFSPFVLSSAAAIPEPTTAAIFTVGLGMLARRRRRV